ncbi:MAG TPA: hypothetical protein VLC92_04980 [Rhodocyclaceae bacterium]|nr:hypothetical protein [Rhodocyclaceae bacterium]
MARQQFDCRNLQKTAANWGALAAISKSALVQGKPLVAGFIYVSPRDGLGYNQAHAQAVALIKKMPCVEVSMRKTHRSGLRSSLWEVEISADEASDLFTTGLPFFISFGKFPYCIVSCATWRGNCFKRKT